MARPRRGRGTRTASERGGRLSAEQAVDGSPKLLASLGGIQLFIHDSLHTEQNMLFEFEAAWSKLEPGCALLADDIQESAAFASFLTVRALGTALVGIAETKTSLFGLALKPAET